MHTHVHCRTRTYLGGARAGGHGDGDGAEARCGCAPLRRLLADVSRKRHRQHPLAYTHPPFFRPLDVLAWLLTRGAHLE